MIYSVLRVFLLAFKKSRRELVSRPPETPTDTCRTATVHIYKCPESPARLECRTRWIGAHGTAHTRTRAHPPYPPPATPTARHIGARTAKLRERLTHGLTHGPCEIAAAHLLACALLERSFSDVCPCSTTAPSTTTQFFSESSLDL